jgi:hypothetical protein
VELAVVAEVFMCHYDQDKTSDYIPLILMLVMQVLLMAMSFGYFLVMIGHMKVLR